MLIDGGVAVAKAAVKKEIAGKSLIIAKQLQDQRKKILAEVKKYVSIQNQTNVFVPGESRINYAGRVFNDQEYLAMVNASLDGWVTLGSYGKKLEQALARFLGRQHVILVNSGSSANLVAVAALCSPKLPKGLRPGDEVITPAATFPTTLSPIIQHQLVPVFVDATIGEYTIDVAKIEAALSPKTRAIMMPHTLGNPCRMDVIRKIADRYKLFVIEDNCDALGSTYQGQLTGSFSELSTYSFYPAHHMTMGEGGAVATDDPKLAELCRSIRDWGRDCWCDADSGSQGACKNRFNYKIEGLSEEYDHKYMYSNQGYNLKPTDLQAALGLAQIQKLPGFIRTRKKNFQILTSGLQAFADRLILPEATPGSDPSWFAFPITIKENAGFTRKQLITFLEAKGIETRLLFAGNILRQPAYKFINHRVHGVMEISDIIMRNTFFIGVYPGLNAAKLKYIINAFKAFFKELSNQQ